MTKQLITVKREWGNPTIYLERNDAEIRITCDINVFVEQFLNKVPSMTFVIKDETAKNLIKKALEETFQELKDESIKVI